MVTDRTPSRTMIHSVGLCFTAVHTPRFRTHLAKELARVARLVPRATNLRYLMIRQSEGEYDPLPGTIIKEKLPPTKNYIRMYENCLARLRKIRGGGTFKSGETIAYQRMPTPPPPLSPELQKKIPVINMDAIKEFLTLPRDEEFKVISNLYARVVRAKYVKPELPTMDYAQREKFQEIEDLTVRLFDQSNAVVFDSQYLGGERKNFVDAFDGILAVLYKQNAAAVLSGAYRANQKLNFTPADYEQLFEYTRQRVMYAFEEREMMFNTTRVGLLEEDKIEFWKASSTAWVIEASNGKKYFITPASAVKRLLARHENPTLFVALQKFIKNKRKFREIRTSILGMNEELNIAVLEPTSQKRLKTAVGLYLNGDPYHEKLGQVWCEWLWLWLWLW